MSTQKQLPDNLKQLEQKPRFKQVYKQHTDEQLEETLRFIELVEREGESWDCIKLDNQEDEE